jgi:hypothetical protein
MKKSFLKILDIAFQTMHEHRRSQKKRLKTEKVFTIMGVARTDFFPLVHHEKDPSLKQAS